MTDNKTLTTMVSTPISSSLQSKRGGVYSVNIVCAQDNRKSITLSKKLADKLGLTTGVYITVYANDGLIALSPVSIDENALSCSFSNTNDRIIYNASLVRFLVTTFELDYNDRTSLSFRNIEFASVSGIPVAKVFLSNTLSTSSRNIHNEQVTAHADDN